MYIYEYNTSSLLTFVLHFVFNGFCIYHHTTRTRSGSTTMKAGLIASLVFPPTLLTSIPKLSTQLVPSRIPALRRLSRSTLCTKTMLSSPQVDVSLFPSMLYTRFIDSISVLIFNVALEYYKSFHQIMEPSRTSTPTPKRKGNCTAFVPMERIGLRPRTSFLLASTLALRA